MRAAGRAGEGSRKRSGVPPVWHCSSQPGVPYHGRGLPASARTQRCPAQNQCLVALGPGSGSGSGVCCVVAIGRHSSTEARTGASITVADGRVGGRADGRGEVLAAWVPVGPPGPLSARSPLLQVLTPAESPSQRKGQLEAWQAHSAEHARARAGLRGLRGGRRPPGDRRDAPSRQRQPPDPGRPSASRRPTRRA